jgi:hypothetical protein
MTTSCDDAATPTVDTQAYGLSVPPPESPEKRGSGGAPSDNQNAYKHGLRSAKLGPGMEYIGRKASMFRKVAEAETLSLRGKLGVWEQSLIQSATQWLITAFKIERLLRLYDDKLTIEQRVNYTERVSRALVERDRCLQRLGLDKGDEALSTLYSGLPDEPEGQTNAPAEPPA